MRIIGEDDNSVARCKAVSGERPDQKPMTYYGRGAIRVESLFEKEGIIRSIEMGGIKPDNFFQCKNFSEMPEKSGHWPKNMGGPKIKKSFFAVKKREKIRIRHPKKKLSKKIHIFLCQLKRFFFKFLDPSYFPIFLAFH